MEDKPLDKDQAQDVWRAFENLYPSVAENEQPGAFAKKLKEAYAVVFLDGSRHSSTAL